MIYKEKEELKFSVLVAYGGGIHKCEVCGESRLNRLTIDMIDGLGYCNQEQEEALYSLLDENVYPDGFQVLCRNCQYAKRHTNSKRHQG